MKHIRYLHEFAPYDWEKRQEYLAAFFQADDSGLAEDRPQIDSVMQNEWYYVWKMVVESELLERKVTARAFIAQMLKWFPEVFGEVASEEQEKWYFSIVDVVEILTDSVDPKQYIKKMKTRDPELGSNWGTICTLVDMKGKDGRMREQMSAGCAHFPFRTREFVSIHIFCFLSITKLWILFFSKH